MCSHDAIHTHTHKKNKLKKPRISLQWGKCNLATVCVFGPTGTCIKDLTIKSQVCYNVQTMNA